MSSEIKKNLTKLKKSAWAAKQHDDVEQQNTVDDAEKYRKWLNDNNDAWEHLKKKASEASSAEVMAYNSEFKNAYMALFSLGIELQKALHSELQRPLDFLERKAVDYIVMPMSKTLYALVTNDYPKIDFKTEVNMNDSGKLIVKKNVTASLKAEQAERNFNGYLKDVVQEWLKNVPNVAVDDKGTYKKDGNVLTKDGFNKLKNDPEHGLDAYLGRPKEEHTPTLTP